MYYSVSYVWPYSHTFRVSFKAYFTATYSKHSDKDEDGII